MQPGTGFEALLRHPVHGRSSRTNGQNGARLVMQDDGNLVMYGPNGAAFATGTNAGENRGAVLEVQDDGNIVVYAPGRRPIWPSMSKGEQAITWFYDRIGSTFREGLCQKAVQEAFGYIPRATQTLGICGTSGRATDALPIRPRPVGPWSSTTPGQPMITSPSALATAKSSPPDSPGASA
jgi:hypothetical protein